MNLCTFIVVGETSAISYQILGHVKTVSVWLLGVIIFKTKFDIRNFIGFLIAITGAILYSMFRISENKPNIEKQTEQEIDDKSNKV